MKWLKSLSVVLVCFACAGDRSLTFFDVEDPSDFNTVVIAERQSGHYCYSDLLGKNISVFHFDSPNAPDFFPSQIVRNPSQDWINNYFKPQIENKQFYYSVSFPNDTVVIRLFIPANDSTLIRQAFISESEILKSIGPVTYSSGYLYPPGKELPISWDLTDSLGVRLPSGWYAFSTEFVEEDRAILFWFWLFE